MIQEYVSLASHGGELYALTKDGQVYRIILDDFTGTIKHAVMMFQLPEVKRF